MVQKEGCKTIGSVTSCEFVSITAVDGTTLGYV